MDLLCVLPPFLNTTSNIYFNFITSFSCYDIYLDEISEIFSSDDNDERNQTVVNSSEHILDHDEDEGSVVDAGDSLRHDHGDAVDDDIDEEEKHSGDGLRSKINKYF